LACPQQYNTSISETGRHRSRAVAAPCTCATSNIKVSYPMHRNITQDLPAHKCKKSATENKRGIAIQVNHETTSAGHACDDGPTGVIPPTLTVCCTAAPHASPPVAFSDPAHQHSWHCHPAAVVEAVFHVMPRMPSCGIETQHCPNHR